MAKFAARFPSVERASVEVKGYLAMRLPSPADLVPVAAWLKGELGFSYLDMVTAVDYLGPVDPKGYVAEPNPNPFDPKAGAASPEPVARTQGFPYREAFELVYCLSNLQAGMKVFLKVDVPRREPRLPSLAPLFKAADWQEREVFDLLGVEFEGHPNLSKILTPDFMAGHPLRKDYAYSKDMYDS